MRLPATPPVLPLLLLLLVLSGCRCEESIVVQADGSGAAAGAAALTDRVARLELLLADLQFQVASLRQQVGGVSTRVDTLSEQRLAPARVEAVLPPAPQAPAVDQPPLRAGDRDKEPAAAPQRSEEGVKDSDAPPPSPRGASQGWEDPGVDPRLGDYLILSQTAPTGGTPVSLAVMSIRSSVGRAPAAKGNSMRTRVVSLTPHSLSLCEGCAWEWEVNSLLTVVTAGAGQPSYSIAVTATREGLVSLADSTGGELEALSTVVAPTVGLSVTELDAARAACETAAARPLHVTHDASDGVNSH